MYLTDLLQVIDVKEIINLPYLSPRPIGKIVTHWPSEISNQDIFVAIKGIQNDSHAWIDEIAKLQPLAIIVNQNWNQEVKTSVPILKTEDTRKALSHLLNAFYGNWSKDVHAIAITGTNGKTTTSIFLEHILCSSDLKVLRVGTLGYFWNKRLIAPNPLTTPPLDAFFQIIPPEKPQILIMETSSHALDQGRVDGIWWNQAVWTHFSQDHLDYHKSMENYFQAKSRLFCELLPRSIKNLRKAIINDHEDTLRSFALDLKKTGSNLKVQLISEISENFHLQNRSLEGQTWVWNHPKLGKIKFQWPWLADFQVINCFCALGASLTLVSEEAIIEALQNPPSIPGRLQKVTEIPDYHIFIDYAHTPEALKLALLNLRKVTSHPQKIWVIFGAGGNRDASKRPLMGQVAQNWADKIIITSDNPRMENPLDIINDILKGLSHPDNVIIEVDRASAIARAAELMAPNDVLLIAGKGHETYQEINGQKIPFNDYEEVLKKFPH